MDGLVQYLSKTPSTSHFTRERYRDVARTAESAIVWYSFLDSFGCCGRGRVGRGLLSVIFVGSPSSAIGVDGRRTGVDTGMAFFLLVFVDDVLGVVFAGVGFLGVEEVGLVARIGEDALRFAADSRRSRAGRIRFCGKGGGATDSSAIDACVSISTVTPDATAHSFNVLSPGEKTLVLGRERLNIGPRHSWH